MKKLLLLLVLLQLSVFVAKAQNCGTFPAGTICSQAPSGQQTNCCRCIGTQYQNQAFCGGTPINSGLIFLIIAGLGLGSFLLTSQLSGSKELLS